MKGQVIIDNWSLSEIKEIVLNGAMPSDNSQLKSGLTKIYSYPRSAIRLKALINFLVDVVTRDEILVEKWTKRAWLGKLSALDKLDQAGIIKELPDYNSNHRISYEDNVGVSCYHFPSKLQKNEIDEKNEIDTNELFRTRHEGVIFEGDENYNNLIIIGAQIYLQGSSIVNSPYSPHPYREHYLRSTYFPPHFPDAGKSIRGWIRNERTNILEGINSNFGLKIADTPIDPIIIEIIENSSTTNDLFGVAMQMRDSYKAFRNFLTDFQGAINSDDIKTLQKKQKILEDVHNKVINFKNPERYGKFSLSLGVGFFKYTNSSPLIDRFLMKNGVRVTLQNLVLKSGANQSLKKLLKMFDIKDAKVEVALKELLKS